MKRFVLSVSCGFALSSIGLVAAAVFGAERGVTGACCFPDGSCQVLEQISCENSGGEYQGNGTFCGITRGAVNCLPTGACCTANQGCLDDLNEDLCEGEFGGVWYGPGSYCAKTPGSTFAGPGGGVICGGPPNDQCEDAIAIYSFDLPEFGTVAGANPDFIRNCERGVDLEANGVWYSVMGTGSILQASVCGVGNPDLNRGDTRSYLFVYCGGCENLQCVAGDGGILVDCNNRTLDPVSWCSALGQEYLIFVALEGEFTEDFALYVNDTEQPCKALACNAPNDECEGAILIQQEGLTFGSTFGATFDKNDQICAEPDSITLPSVWYRLVGTGNYVELTLCSQFSRGETFGEINVYCGSCEALNCVVGDFGRAASCAEGARGGDGDGDVRVSWCSEEGRDYYINVMFPPDGGFGLLYSDSGKSCAPDPCGPSNDFCEDAQPICPGIVYTGDTFEATNDYLDHGAPINTVFFCGALMALYDNWYTYTPAESGLLFVHVEQLPVEWVFGVYTDCPENGGQLLNCNYQRHHGVIVAPVNAYQTYYIRIAGFLESRGTYFLDILGPPCVGNEPCNNIAAE